MLCQRGPVLANLRAVLLPNETRKTTGILSRPALIACHFGSLIEYFITRTADKVEAYISSTITRPAHAQSKPDAAEPTISKLRIGALKRRWGLRGGASVRPRYTANAPPQSRLSLSISDKRYIFVNFIKHSFKNPVVKRKQLCFWI